MRWLPLAAGIVSALLVGGLTLWGALRARIGDYEEERRAIAGDPTPWTDEADLPPDVVEARLTAALDAAGFVLRELDCEEDPCVAHAEYRMPEGEDFNTYARGKRDALSQALGDLRFGGSSGYRPAMDGDGGVHYISGAVRLEGAEIPEDDRRTRFRFHALSRLISQELRAGEREEIAHDGAVP